MTRAKEHSQILACVFPLDPGLEGFLQDQCHNTCLKYLSEIFGILFSAFSTLFMNLASVECWKQLWLHTHHTESESLAFLLYWS